MLFPLLALATLASPSPEGLGARTATAEELMRAARDGFGEGCGEDLACLIAEAGSISPTVPGQVTPASPHYDLEVLYHAKRYQWGLRLCKERRAGAPDDLTLAWMEGRFYYELGELYPEDFDKRGWYNEMLAGVEDGLSRHPGDPHLLFLQGLAKARLGTTQGILATLFYVDDVEAAWLAADAAGTSYASLGLEEHLPCDHKLTLGIFYRIIPDSWVIEAITGTRGDLDRSLAYHQAATACSPGRIRSLIERGVTELCLGTTRGDPAMLAQGASTLTQLAAISPTQPTDYIDQENAPLLIAHPELACGYSRDGLQEREPQGALQERAP
ncbi:MAG: hypothetical protein JXX28_12215 [Deltaproteobacteria bacterium]|nr:hypothetical protein [Deltaproteobacteria bacterium]